MDKLVEHRTGSTPPMLGSSQQLTRWASTLILGLPEAASLEKSCSQLRTILHLPLEGIDQRKDALTKETTPGPAVALGVSELSRHLI